MHLAERIKSKIADDDAEARDWLMLIIENVNQITLTGQIDEAMGLTIVPVLQSTLATLTSTLSISLFSYPEFLTSWLRFIRNVLLKFSPNL